MIEYKHIRAGAYESSVYFNRSKFVGQASIFGSIGLAECQVCGAVVSDEAKHTEFHNRLHLRLV